MSVEYKSIKRYIRYLQPHWWIALGETLLAFAIIHRPYAGAPYVLWGIEGSGFMVGLFIAGAILSALSFTIKDYIIRTLAYLFSLIPILIYCCFVLYLFVVVRGLHSSTVTLTTPLAYFGLLSMSVMNYLLVVQLETILEYGADCFE